MSLEQLERRVQRVTSLDDPRVADYRDLRERDLAVRREAFIAESEVVVRVMIAKSAYPIRSVFLADSRLDKLADALCALPASVPLYVAEQAVLNEVAGFPIHRGILASGQRSPLPSHGDLLAGLGDGPHRIVILESLTNHDNVGGVFRNAAAFGVSAVLIDHATCDPLYRKAIRVSVGAALFVPFTRAASSAELIQAAHAAGFSCLALSPRADAKALRSLTDVPERVALLFGTEGAGLSPEAMASADELVRIEMAPDFDSLNVAVTSGIALHALTSQGGGRGRATS